MITIKALEKERLNTMINELGGWGDFLLSIYSPAFSPFPEGNNHYNYTK